MDRQIPKNTLSGQEDRVLDAFWQWPQRGAEVEAPEVMPREGVQQEGGLCAASAAVSCISAGKSSRTKCRGVVAG